MPSAYCCDPGRNRRVSGALATWGLIVAESVIVKVEFETCYHCSMPSFG